VASETTPGDSDVLLLERGAAGDERAFGVLVDRHGGAVRRYVRGLVSDDAAADDVLQQTFLDAYRGAAGFRAESQVRTWLFRIARNAAWHHRKREARFQPVEEAEVESLLELGVSAGWGAADPELLALRASRRESLWAAIQTLEPSDREIVLLRDVEEISGEDVAGLLGLSLAAMKSRLHHARLRLAAALRAADASAEEAANA